MVVVPYRSKTTTVYVTGQRVASIRKYSAINGLNQMAKYNFEGARQLLLEDVEFNYFKDKPVMYKGKTQWEVSIRTDRPEQAEEWEASYLNVRHNGTSTKPATEWVVSLNRKTHKKDGEAQESVRVVDENLVPYTKEERMKIGNASRGNVIVWQGTYNNEHGEGVSTSLTAMQIPRDKLQVYEGTMETVDFANLGDVKSSSGEKAEGKQLF